MDIVYQIQFLQGQLNRQEARIARTILDNPAFASQASIEELAAKAGVSTEIVSHFAKSIGCQDINDFIYHMRSQKKATSPDVPVTPPVLGAMDIAFASASAISKLPGVSPELLSRFAKSIGAEDIGDIIYQIRAQHNQLSQQEGRVAQAILDDVAFASSATIEQLASLAGVSPATITRFAKSVGCDDIRDLRMKLAQASAVGSRYLLAAQPGKASSATAWQQQINQLEQQLHQQLQQFEERAFMLAGEIIRRASKGLYIFSNSGRSSLLANTLQQGLVRAGYPAFAYQDAELMRLTATTLGAEHGVLILSTQGENSELLALADNAAATGAKVIAITQVGSRLSQRSRVVLPIYHDSTQNTARLPGYGMLLAVDLLLANLAL